MAIKKEAIPYVELFKKYGWTVDISGDNDFIAYNDTFCTIFCT